MLTPTVTSKITQFYALGNTPAANIARCLPQGTDADVLLLGYGDLRNILYTAYSEKGLRKFSNPVSQHPHMTLTHNRSSRQEARFHML